MFDPIKEFSVGKVTVKIVPDDDCGQECPIDGLSENDGVIFASFERRSTLKDHNPFDTPEDAQEFAKARGWEIFNLYRYEHGRVAYSATAGGNPFHCQWDSGQVGVVLVNAKAFEECDTTPLKIADDWAKAVTTWVNGDYYGYVVQDEDGNTLDSCWGFDDDEYCESEARDIAKHHAELADEESAREQEAARPDLYGANNVEA